VTQEAWLEHLRWLISIDRPHSKFVSISDSSTFIDPTAELGDGFIYVNLYDENVDNNVVPIRGRIVMIHNTYLSSFAYNLFLSWLYSHSGHADPTLDCLLAHNFKKFFAEQLWRQRSDVASRALLLETLLYEQVCMVPVFTAQGQDLALAKASQDAASIMSLVLSMHELGHFMLNTRPGARAEFLAEIPDMVAPIFARAAERLPEALTDEVRCDMMSVLSCINGNRDALGLEFCLRAVVFAFSAYATMFSLQKSAKAYWESQKQQEPQAVDLRSIEKTHKDHTIPLGEDREFAERASLIADLCKAVAQKEGIRLFDAGGTFPLPETIAADLMGYVHRVLDSDDANTRAMSNLVAEALYGHPEGMEYLYLRSKTFRSNRELPARV
jgi:hypothetical protein